MRSLAFVEMNKITPDAVLGWVVKKEKMLWLKKS